MAIVLNRPVGTKLKNTFLLELSWVSASDFILDIFKSNKFMIVSFLVTAFYRKSKIKQKSWEILDLLCSEVVLLLNYFFLHAN